MKLQSQRYIRAIGIVLMLFSFCGYAQAKKIDIRIGTCGPGGYYYQSGTVVANIINHYVPNVHAVAVTTTCASYNLHAIQAGALEMGLTLNIWNRMAYTGEALYKGPPLNRLRFFSTWYVGYVHFFTLDPKVKSLADLKGKRVAMSQPGGDAPVMVALLKGAGLTEGKDYTAIHTNLSNGISLMKAGQIDAMGWDMPFNNPAMKAFTHTRRVHLIPVTEREFASIPEDFKAGSYFGSIPAHTYPGQNFAVPAVAEPVTMDMSARVNPQVAYKIAAALFEHLGLFHRDLQSSPTAMQVSKASAVAKGVSIPVQKGALKYYREHHFPGAASAR